MPGLRPSGKYPVPILFLSSYLDSNLIANAIVELCQSYICILETFFVAEIRLIPVNHYYSKTVVTMMQAICVHTISSTDLPQIPRFCPRNCRATALVPPNKTTEKIRTLRTSFSESSLSDVKITLDHSYTRIVKMQLESEFFHRDPPFDFTFDDSTFLFLWTIDQLRKSNICYGLSDSMIDENRVTTWRSVLAYAEKVYGQFLEMCPHLDHPDYLPNIRMIAILYSMKFYYDDDSVYDSDFIRAFYLMSLPEEDEATCTRGFKFHLLPDIAQIPLSEIDVGITVYQIRKMEAIFISAIFKHKEKEPSHDSAQPVAVQTNSTRTFGSSSI
jgi:hypothetical protein